MVEFGLMNPATSQTTLLQSLTIASPSARAMRVASVCFLTALTAAAAQVSVPLPFTAVPFTFQPMVVLLGGLALGSRLGASAQVLYLLLGIAGLPVFAASPLLPQGLLRLVGPTGGYLLSYPLAAFVTGLLAERGLDRKYAGSFAAMLVGLAIVYLAGATGLSLTTGVAFSGALAAGVVPFIGADLLKLVAAAGIVPGLWSFLGRRS